MSEEEIRVAIAGACGWRVDLPAQYIKGWPPGSQDRFPRIVPDYANSLDLMHEAEKVLTHPADQRAYGIELLNVVEANEQDANRFNHIHATAAQRAEAFLRTLNLWKP